MFSHLERYHFEVQPPMIFVQYDVHPPMGPSLDEYQVDDIHNALGICY